MLFFVATSTCEYYLQIGVALYLLYNQVGIAFLAGVGFALLLIPINRWIAVKIASLSQRMMCQKDARVKVYNSIVCSRCTFKWVYCTLVSFTLIGKNLVHTNTAFAVASEYQVII